MDKSKKLVFFGTEDFSATSLHALLEAGYDITAVVTKSDSKSGRGQKLSPPAVKVIAESHGIKILQPKNVASSESELKLLKPNLGILVSYGKIIPASVMNLFPLGIVNVHPSLLPVWRGPSPIESAILAGDKLTGVSLMKLTTGMDEGPVFATAELELDGSETSPQLYERLARIGADLLKSSLPAIISGSLQPKAQDDSIASYSRLLKKQDGLIDFHEPSEVIERKIRAYQGFPKARAKVLGHEVVITKAREAKGENDGSLVIKCTSGWLEIQKLVGPSGKTMSGVDFLRGYQKS